MGADTGGGSIWDQILAALGIGKKAEPGGAAGPEATATPSAWDNAMQLLQKEGGGVKAPTGNQLPEGEPTPDAWANFMKLIGIGKEAEGGAGIRSGGKMAAPLPVTDPGGAGGAADNRRRSFSPAMGEMLRKQRIPQQDPNANLPSGYRRDIPAALGSYPVADQEVFRPLQRRYQERTKGPAFGRKDFTALNRRRRGG